MKIVKKNDESINHDRKDESRDIVPGVVRSRTTRQDDLQKTKNNSFVTEKSVTGLSIGVESMNAVVQHKVKMNEKCSSRA